MNRITYTALASFFLLAATAPAETPPPVTKASGCGDYGTAVVFEETPADAAKIARKAEKLVLILHVSGHFETPQFT